MLIDYPWWMSTGTSNLNPTLTIPHLAIWHISGRDTEINNFQMMLLHSCSTHGEQKQTSHMTHCLGDGITSVLKGDPFSEPVRNVVNHIFIKMGINTNAYRSAISSVHDKIDGYDVGHTPL